jgi:hypothetical protein
MERYINQLIEELGEAIAMNINPPIASNQVENIDFPDEAAFEPENRKPIAYWLEKESKIFPPVKLLTVRQMKILSRIMEMAFEKINVAVDLPEKMPHAERYSILLELWDKPVPFMSCGTYHIDFCSGDCEGCRIRKYCRVGRELIKEFYH